MLERAIHKFVVEPTGSSTIQLPIPFQILSVAVQKRFLGHIEAHIEDVCLWIIVPKGVEPSHALNVVLIPTGSVPIPDSMPFIGTVLLDDDALVYHAFVSEREVF